MKNKPPYMIESVDNALLALELLRDRGRVRVSEVADELGIARSTAHRLLSMLVFRDFAERDENRGYVPGRALSAPNGDGRAQYLRRMLLPAMEALCSRVEETVNLMVRVGTQIRFLASVESSQVLRVGDRQGAVLPARATSGGKALLAELSPAEITCLYPGDEGLDELVRELDEVRARGYGLNLEATETGVVAAGRCVNDRSGRAVAALSIAVPVSRFHAGRIEPLANALRECTDRIARDLPTLG
ncbi:IclR family transcriptional regulator [Streptomyces sp. NPDC050625]|uniref:IclR family transcriptional regulator n=1 Tax=Streptomyces sp. NPDC050625 TaxID=3154629 RepID=UPI003412AA57